MLPGFYWSPYRMGGQLSRIGSGNHPSRTRQTRSRRHRRMSIIYHNRNLEKRLAKDRLHDLDFQLETMAGSIENSRDLIHLDDIGLERLRHPFSLRSVDPYDSTYTPTKTPSYQVTGREVEATEARLSKSGFFVAQAQAAS